MLILFICLTVLVSVMKIPSFAQVQSLLLTIFFLLFLPFPEARAKHCDTLSHLNAISSLTVDGKSMLSSSLLYSFATSSVICETVVPPDSLMDLTCFTFNNLSSCILHSMALSLSNSIKDIFYPGWLSLYLVEAASSVPILHKFCLDFLDYLVNSSLIDLTLQKTYKQHAYWSCFTCELAFDLSFDKVILKTLGHWHGLLTFGIGIPSLFLMKFPFVGYSSYCFPQML